MLLQRHPEFVVAIAARDEIEIGDVGGMRCRGETRHARRCYRARWKSLVDVGVVGINLEDSQIVESNRSLQDADTFARKLEALKGLLESNGKEVFVNVRSDTYLLNIPGKRAETTRRAEDV